MNTQCDNYQCHPGFMQRVLKAPAEEIAHSLAGAIGRAQRLRLIRARLLAQAVNAHHAGATQAGECCNE